MLKDLFRSRPRYVTVRIQANSQPTELERKNNEQSLWVRCDDCGELLYQRKCEESVRVRSVVIIFGSAAMRIEQLLDPDTFQEINADIVSGDPSAFLLQRELTKSRERTKLNEAVVTGEAKIGGYPVMFGVIDFEFMGGSMGSAVGRRFVVCLNGPWRPVTPLSWFPQAAVERGCRKVSCP